MSRPLQHKRYNAILVTLVCYGPLIVVFGGLVALLPVFARDILQVGEAGLGFLAAAPAIGAVSVAFLLARQASQQPTLVLAHARTRYTPPDVDTFKRLEDAGMTSGVHYPFRFALGEDSSLEAKRALLLEYTTAADKFQEELDEVEDNLRRLPRVTADIARLQAEEESAREILSRARLSIQPLRDRVKSLRNASSTLGLGGGIVGGRTFEILEEGIEPETPVLPIGAIIMAVSLLLGIGLGLAGPILTEMTRSSFGSVKEVSRSLGVPVLGAVDLILTARDVRARAVQSWLTITTMVIVLLALGTFLYLWATNPGVLPTGVNRAVRDLQLSLT